MEGIPLKIRDRLQGCYNCPKNCHLVVKPPGTAKIYGKTFGRRLRGHFEQNFSQWPGRTIALCAAGDGTGKIPETSDEPLE